MRQSKERAEAKQLRQKGAKAKKRGQQLRLKATKAKQLKGAAAKAKRLRRPFPAGFLARSCSVQKTFLLPLARYSP
jgi:hypothetical protein